MGGTFRTASEDPPRPRRWACTPKVRACGGLWGLSEVDPPPGSVPSPTLQLGSQAAMPGSLRNPDPTRYLWESQRGGCLGGDMAASLQV